MSVNTSNVLLLGSNYIFMCVFRNVISYKTTNQPLVPYSKLSESGEFVWSMLVFDVN